MRFSAYGFLAHGCFDSLYIFDATIMTAVSIELGMKARFKNIAHRCDFLSNLSTFASHCIFRHVKGKNAQQIEKKEQRKFN